jgi:hypothetical protein
MIDEKCRIELCPCLNYIVILFSTQNTNWINKEETKGIINKTIDRIL